MPVTAQMGACGVVDEIDYPIDIGDTLRRNFDDFARFRQRWGGNHTGIDLGFNRHLEPVSAAARGRVTYADPEGWDTEKGVVILEHIFPDGSVFYSLYGHMEETDMIRFPAVGACVDMGQTMGVIGDPLQSLPHLHFEIRNFLPNDGGPGYVNYNPRRDGWYQPLDFIEVWRSRLQGGVVNVVTFIDVPTLPPITLSSGATVSASGAVVSAIDGRGSTQWSVTAGGAVIGLAALSDDRVIVYAEGGQVFTLRGGRYLAVWKVDGIDSPLALIGDTVVFLTSVDGQLTAYTSDGQIAWTTPGTDGVPRYLGSNGREIGLLTGSGGSTTFWQFGADGSPIGAAIFERVPTITPINGSWIALEGMRITRIRGGVSADGGVIPVPAGRSARMAVDALGNLYVYADDPQDTLLSIDVNGRLRWQTVYPTGGAVLLGVDNGCVLYALDADGTLNAFSAADGGLINQRHLYTGGEGTARPAARLLRVDQIGQVQIGAGFFSMLTLDNAVIGSDALASCLLG